MRLKGLALATLMLSVFVVSGIGQTTTDKKLADWLRDVTNRSSEGLVEHRRADGGVSVDLNGRFQNVMMARTDFRGDLKVGCVNDIAQAGKFLGRDLETGVDYPGIEEPVDSLRNTASAHGMSKKEFVFYRQMIERFENRNSLGGAGTTFTIVNADDPGEGFNDTTATVPEGGNNGATLGEQRLNLFEFAGNIWGAFLDSSIDVAVNAQFDPLTCTPTSAVLGSAGTTTVHRDFTNAGFTGTWYHQALANKQSGVDRSGNPDINTTFNSNINGTPSCLGGRRFYLGFDNTTPAGTTNLLIVLLHEIGHGLGFSDFANGQTGALFQGFPDVFTTHMFDSSTSEMWNDMTNGERATSAINNRNVFWSGANVSGASDDLVNGRDAMTGRVELFTPNPFQGGSSISHFGSVVSPSVLMEPSISFGLPLDLDLTRQQMRDIGWFRDTDQDGTADTITNVAPNAATLPPGSAGTVTWTNNGTFARNVTIEISFDGGTTFPEVVAEDVTNTGSFAFTVPSTTTSTAQIRVREHDFVDPVGISSNFTIGMSVAAGGTKFDFDGDNKTDPSIFRPSVGQWWLSRSSDGGNRVFAFGTAADTLVPADYTGDGIADVAFWRETTGEWFVLRSEDQSFFSFPFGTAGDIPAPGDFDGDGTDDAGIFRPSTGTWFLLRSSDGGTSIVPFGAANDIPLVGDYDGDGSDDVAIYRPDVSQFWQLRSSQGVLAFTFGNPGDSAFTADFTGDGTSDMGLLRDGRDWFILRSDDQSFFGFPFGAAGDIPTPGDYDGDGTADPAVFRPSTNTWFAQGSTSGALFFQFGASGDIPLPNLYVAD